MSASKPSTFLLFLFSFKTSAHRNPHRQLDNGPAAPVYANAGLAYGPPITPTKHFFNNGAGFRIGGPPEITLTKLEDLIYRFCATSEAQPSSTGTRRIQWIRVARGERSLIMRIRLLVVFRRIRIG
ncbi:MAG: hypothetical protein Q9161_005863 [Pseudevernia consocians]